MRGLGLPTVCLALVMLVWAVVSAVRGQWGEAMLFVLAAMLLHRLWGAERRVQRLQDLLGVRDAS